MRVLRIALAVCVGVIAGSSAAQAQKRIALLIGNQSYTSEIGRLANPHNDIALLEKTLKELRFEVTTVRDAGLAALHQAVNAHVRRIKAAGPDAIAFTYYSGHGAADGSTNYLIPVDVKSAEDGELWDQSLRLSHITRQLKSEAGNATHFVVFDACRNVLKLYKPGTRSLVQSKGFAAVAQESGMLIAYSTAEGELASDVGQGAGPYAKMLAEEIVKPGVEAVYMFRNVQRRLRAAIGQEPYLGFNAVGDVYLAGVEAPKPPPVTAVPTPAQPQPTLSEAERAWAAAKDTTSIAVLEDFVARYKETFYAGLARARIEELKKQQVAVAPSPPAKQSGLIDQTLGIVLPKQAPPNAPVRCDGVEALVGNERRCLKPGAGKTEWFKDCPSCPEMVVAPVGRFTMGSPKDEPERGGFEDEVSVTISAPFTVGRFAVARGEFAAFVASTGHKTDGGCYIYTGSQWKQQADRDWRSPGFSQTARHPAVCVSWDDAKAYVAWLSKATGKSYRLLSRAEREYVARAGTTTPFWWGSGITPTQANYNGIAEPYKGGGTKGEFRKATVPVDGFAANPWGLYNVHGNVREWVEDCQAYKNAGNPSAGSAGNTSDCISRFLRGGSWIFEPKSLRSASGSWQLSDSRDYDLGFRIARTLD
jgi:formylglycine-generating enzyme required for sulfatase activity